MSSDKAKASISYGISWFGNSSSLHRQQAVFPQYRFKGNNNSNLSNIMVFFFFLGFLSVLDVYNHHALNNSMVVMEEHVLMFFNYDFLLPGPFFPKTFPWKMFCSKLYLSKFLIMWLRHCIFFIFIVFIISFCEVFLHLFHPGYNHISKASDLLLVSSVQVRSDPYRKTEITQYLRN